MTLGTSNIIKSFIVVLKFLLKKVSLSKLAGFKLLLCLFTIMSVTLNTLSLGTDVPDVFSGHLSHIWICRTGQPLQKWFTEGPLRWVWFLSLRQPSMDD